MYRKTTTAQPTHAKRHVRQGKTKISLRNLTVLLCSMFWSFGIEERFRSYPKGVHHSTRGSERKILHCPVSRHEQIQSIGVSYFSNFVARYS